MGLGQYPNVKRPATQVTYTEKITKTGYKADNMPICLVYEFTERHGEKLLENIYCSPCFLSLLRGSVFNWILNQENIQNFILTFGQQWLKYNSCELINSMFLS